MGVGPGTFSGFVISWRDACFNQRLALEFQIIRKNEGCEKRRVGDVFCKGIELEHLGRKEASWMERALDGEAPFVRNPGMQWPGCIHCLHCGVNG